MFTNVLRTFLRIGMLLLSVGVSSCGFLLDISQSNLNSETLVSTSTTSSSTTSTSTSTTTTSSTTTTTISLSVGPAYTNGAKWNDYVKNDGADIWAANDIACVGTETPYSACIHGGEIRKVVITGVSSCSGLTLADSLGVFDWTCKVSGGTATFFSALKTNKGLRDLLAPTDWLQNQVTLSGTHAGISSLAIWWTNAVGPLPNNATPGAGVVSLATASYVYVVPVNETRNTDGYNINAHKVSLVTLTGAKILWNNGSADNCNWATGEVGTADDPCVVATGAQDYLWIEADIDASSGFMGLYIVSSRFSKIFKTTISGGGNNGDQSLTLNAVNSSRIKQVTAQGNQANPWPAILIGWAADSSNHNLFEDIWASNNVGAGLGMESGQYNIFNGVTSANNGGSGIYVGSYCNGGTVHYNSFNNIGSYNNSNGIYINWEFNSVTNFLLVGNSGSGLDLANSCGYSIGSVLSNGVIAFNNIGMDVTAGATLNNLVFLKNQTYGLRLNGGSAPQAYSHIAVSDSGTKDIRLENGQSFFHGNLLVNNATSCTKLAGNGVLDATCAPETSSTATLFYKGSLLGDFVQNISINDVANSSDTAGDATFPAAPLTFDWFRFDNIFRLWGKWAVAGRWTAGVGSILDFRLKSLAAKILNTTNLVTSANGAFVAGGPCPAAVHGNKAVTDNTASWGGGYTNRTFLMNATEILDPSIAGYALSAGNHNGLCESNERCIYTPNFGAYQGEGSLATCTFTNGTVTGVTMYGYSTNGIP